MASTVTRIGTWTGEQQTLTTGSISVSNGDLIAIVGASISTFSSFSDSLGLSWTTSATDGFSERIFTRVFTAGQTFTVTWSQYASGAYGIAVSAYRITGYDTSTPIGASGGGRLNSTQSYNAPMFTSAASGSTMLAGAYDLNRVGAPSSGDLDEYAYNTGGSLSLCGLVGTKTLGSPGAQTANLTAPASGPNWCWLGIEIIPAADIRPADATSTTTFGCTVTATTDTPADVTSTTTFGPTVTANVTQSAAVTSTTTFSSTANVPVPRVESTTTFGSTVTAAETPPQLAAASSTTTFGSTVAATGMFSAQVVSATTWRSRVTPTRTGAAPVTSPYGALRIGRVELTEDYQVSQKGGDTRTLTVSGQEAVTTVAAPTQAQLRDRAEALLAYGGTIVPVTWTAFPHLDGWYRVGSPGADELTWYEQTVVEWSVDLTRVGSVAEMEVESRLIGSGRSHSSSATPEIWHCPPCGADSYTVGPSTPGWVTRIGADGVSHVYRALPAGSSPRYGVTAGQALAGAATVTVSGGARTGLTCPDVPTSWTLSNGILRVEPRATTGTLLLTSYLADDWGTPKPFDVKRGGNSLGPAAHVTILRNDACEVVLRLTWDNLPGRTTCDLSLRRGSRFVGLHLQQSAVADLQVDDALPGGIYGVEGDLGSSGWTSELRDDPDGNRWVMGSPVACEWPGAFGLAPVVSSLSLPAFIGCVRGGTGAVAGDTASDLNRQYLGAPTETERVIAR